MATAPTKNPPHKQAELFILESLTHDDEHNGRYEGRILADILRLCGLQPRYFYLRTRKELEHFVPLYKDSKYRYLHLSCHGTDRQLLLTHDALTFDEFGEVFAGALKNGRLFISACEAGSQKLIDGVGKKNQGMYSIMAPSQKIPFADAMAFWAAFYVRLFTSTDAAKHEAIVSTITSLRKLFPTKFQWSYFDAGKSKSWKSTEI